jgi:hypothetical protein
MPVQIVDQPALAGWRDGILYLEVHPQLIEDTRDLATEAQRVITNALARGVDQDVRLDNATVARIVTEKRGLPFPIFGRDGTLDRYLGESRIIENVANETPTAITDNR